ncbi:MAG TPA: CoA transferase [Pseudonocardiaceae bacterium]|nr:CoA transferase [Pseudonocardiaceae bacterium]
MTAIAPVQSILGRCELARGAGVSAAVAAGLLGSLGCRGIEGGESGELLFAGPDGSLHGEIGWAGPVDLPLADELSVQAACGIMHVHGRRFGRPTALAVDYVSAVAGVLAAQGLLAGSLARSRGSDVHSVRTSAAQAALLAVGQYLAAATAADDWPEPDLPGGPPFTSADGTRFEIETLDPLAWQRFWAELDTDRSAVARGWRPFQHRFATATCPLPAGLAEAIGRSDFSAVLTAGRNAGVSVLRVRESVDSTAGTDRPPCRVTPLSGVRGPMPPVAGTAPLAGIRVVEAGRRVQGPLAGRMLGLLGADVLRIEPPGGDPLRGMPPMAGDCSARFLALNHGKRAIEIDLKSAAGRRSVLDLAAGSDVFLHNWAPGAAARLRLDANDVASANPGIVYAWASGWGDEFGADPPLGTDYVVQAHSGLAALLDEQAPTPSLMTLTDVLGGLIAAFGVLAGLIGRQHTGSGQRVDSSLLSAATVLTGLGRARPHGPLAVPVCTDLAALATDPRFARALDRHGCWVIPGAPWEFQ